MRAEGRKPDRDTTCGFFLGEAEVTSALRADSGMAETFFRRRVVRVEMLTSARLLRATCNHRSREVQFY